MNEINDVLVLKVGTSTLTRRNKDGTFALDTGSFKRIGDQILQLEEAGSRVVLVTSSGITAGMAVVKLRERPDKQSGMPDLQMLASVGWHKLVGKWEQALPGKIVGGMLLTDEELNPGLKNSALQHERNQALRLTQTHLRHGIIPIINENDAIANEEIAIGDNDRLAAMFAAQLAKSTLFGRNPAGSCTVRLIILSDVDGVYEDKHDSATRIAQIDDIAQYAHLAGGAGSMNGTGGMATKFDAARIATASGVPMWITDGSADNAIAEALAGQRGTYFPA